MTVEEASYLLINEAHVVPVGDGFHHEHWTDSCPCGPSVELATTPHGDGWLYVHHSLDRRER